MLNLPAEIVTAKNQLYSDTPFYELLEIRQASGAIHRIVNNNADVSWGGYTWNKFAFEPGEEEDSADGGQYGMSARVSNATGTMQGYLEADPDGMIGDRVIYRYVYPPISTAAIEAWFDIVDASADDEWVYFTLGAENWFMNRFPANVFRRDMCWYKPFMTDICRFVNSTVCDRHFATCISLGQSLVSGCQPGIPGGAFNV